MKIIALLPVKNGATYLPTYLASVSKVADQIIALDDSSSDGTFEILQNNSVLIYKADFPGEKVVNMSTRRNFLLTKGREQGGTHFIWLDVDETFSSNFLDTGRHIIAGLQPGEKYSMRWVHIWKKGDQYLDDKHSPFGYIWKDFIVCDSPEQVFSEAFLSEGRTPGSHELLRELPEDKGVVLHFQFQDWDTVQRKQAWYRCVELIKKGQRAARRINHIYSITLDNPALKTKPLPSMWTDGLPLPHINTKEDANLKEILSWFDKYGILYFEPLQIWHIESLLHEFVARTHQIPQSKVYPSTLVFLNKLKNSIKKIFNKA